MNATIPVLCFAKVSPNLSVFTVKLNYKSYRYEIERSIFLNRKYGDTPYSQSDISIRLQK